MALVRSPRYPSMSLEDAIENGQTIFEKDRRHPITREVAAGHIGYKSLNGAADAALSSLMQYGIIEKVAKGEVRITQRTIDILHPDQPSQRAVAIKSAADSPTLFRTLDERFPEAIPSTETLRSFLTRENFNARAIGPIVAAYTKTRAFVAKECANDFGVPRENAGAESGATEDNDGPKKPAFGNARVGDLIQWEIDGALQMETPMRVRLVSDDGQWVAVEGSETGIPMEQVLVEEPAAAPPAPPPMFKLHGAGAAEAKTEAGETEWMRNLVGKETKVRLLVSGEMGPKEIGKLIKLLEAQKAVLADDDEYDL